MDKNHFGSSRVHEILAEYLTELGDTTLQRKVISMLSQYHHDMKEIYYSNLSLRMRTITWELIKNKYIEESVNNSTLSNDEFLRTLLINVLTVTFRRFSKYAKYYIVKRKQKNEKMS